MSGTELQALIFDVDGTLADNERDGHRVAFNRAFREAGLDWHWDVPTYDRLLEVFGGKERLRHYIESYRSDFRPAEGIDRFIRRLHACKTQHYIELLRSGAIPLRPGVERLLRETRAAGLKLAVASTTTPENVTVLLEQAVGPDAPGWFDVVAAGDMVERKKPAPDVYLLALERLGLTAAECLVVEDAEAGLAAARAAGLATVITVNSATCRQHFDDALLVVDQLGEPGRPMRVLAGDATGSAMVDLALLRRLHAARF
jgi:HAD superfamily hydrolase (TIGR01509 family)